MDKKYALSAFGYLLIGLALGIYMAASENHSQLVTHAHIMLLGFVVSFIYAVCCKIWIKKISKIIHIQFYLHQIGSVTLLVSLFLLYGNFISGGMIGPIAGVASLMIFAGAIIMKYEMIKAFKKQE